jgi:hypothetical protein
VSTTRPSLLVWSVGFGAMEFSLIDSHVEQRQHGQHRYQAQQGATIRRMTSAPRQVAIALDGQPIWQRVRDPPAFVTSDRAPAVRRPSAERWREAVG